MKSDKAKAPKTRARASRPFCAIVTAAIASVTLAGCTSLSVIPDRVVSADKTGMALSGAPYALPMLQYELELSRILSACPQQVEIAGDTVDGVFWRDGLPLSAAPTR